MIDFLTLPKSKVGSRKSVLLSTAECPIYFLFNVLGAFVASIHLSSCREAVPPFGSYIELRPPKGLPEMTVFACRNWYANPVIPNLHDCQTALGRLPVNEDPILYRPLRRSPNDPKSLLVVETHGQYIITLLLPTAFGPLSWLTQNARPGTCELRLHASGQWTEENDFSINIRPNQIRDFFSFALERCVNEENQGGFVIEELTNVCDWLVAPDTEFPGEPPRRPGGPRNLRIRKVSF